MAKATNRIVQQIEHPVELIDIFKHLEAGCKDLIEYIQWVMLILVLAVEF